MYANSVPALLSKNVGNTLTNYKTWGGIIYNVKDVGGAQGGGLHDDTAEIQKTMQTAGLNGGGIVFFPPDSYLITETLINNYNNVHLVGCGMGDSSKIFSNVDITLIQFGVYTSGVFDNSKLRYFQGAEGIDFQNRSGSKANPNVVVAACQFVRVKDCSFSTGGTGIKILKYSDHGIYSDNVFYNQNVGMEVYGAAGINSTGIRIDGNEFQGGSVGVLMDQTFGDIQVCDNQFIGPQYGIKCTGASPSTYSNKIGITGNDFDGAQEFGIYLEGCNHVIISNNNMATDPAVGVGISLVFCQNIDVADNNVSAGANGVRVHSGANNNLSNNMLINIIGYGIVLESNTTDVTVENNRIDSYLDCIHIADSNCTGNRLRFNNCASSTGIAVTTFDYDTSNLIMDENGSIYKIYDPASRAGNRSKVGDHIHMVNFLGITSSSVYTQLINIAMDTYMSGKIDLTFSVFLTGSGLGMYRQTSVLFGRVSTGAVNVYTIDDQESANVFDLNLNVATEGHLIIEIRRNSAGGGTEIRGSIVAKVTGAITSIA